MTVQELLPRHDPHLGLDTFIDHGDRDLYVGMIAELRAFLDYVAAARPDDHTTAELTTDLRAWRSRLGSMVVPEVEQVFGRNRDLPGRAQTMAPPFVVSELDPAHVRGVVRFGRYFLGRNGAAHGGAITLFLDEVFGTLVGNSRSGRLRTAFLHADFRSTAPVGAELDVHAWLVNAEGRKRSLKAEIRHGEVLCVEAEALFVALNPDQP